MAVLVALLAARLAEAQGAVRRQGPESDNASPHLCQVILRAAATAELRPDLPWLEAHEAALALDLAELPEETWLWRVLLRGPRCDGVDRRQGYVARARDFTPAAYPGLAEKAWELDVERRVVRDGREVMERRAARLDEVDRKRDVAAVGAVPRLVGGFSGVEEDDDDD